MTRRVSTSSIANQNRRQFLQTAAAVGVATVTPYWFSSSQARGETTSKNDRPTIGCIGTGDRWKSVGMAAKNLGDILAVCDVDKDHLETANKMVGGKADQYEDYRRVLARGDIDLVTIATPDHWHAKIAIEAMQAGKDVYCEKPMTLTIDEGKQICEVQKQTGRVCQVGTQQRSEFVAVNQKTNKEYPHQFLQAVALAHTGRLGTIRRVTCAIGTGPSSPEIPRADVPAELNWEMWLGQAPLVDYISSPPTDKRRPYSRCHYEFRWWYEYSGGKMTDWGAHHVDIAQWILGMDHSGPTAVEGTADFPVALADGRPTIDNKYNTATRFKIACTFPGGAEIIIRANGNNGLTIEGDNATIFVSRNELKDISGDVIAGLDDQPVPEADLIQLCKGKKPGSHMRNFIECVGDRSEPVSDVHTHHRALTTCHLANIAIRLGRPLNWDPDSQQIVGDAEANGWLSREQRKGYEIKV